MSGARDPINLLSVSTAAFLALGAFLAIVKSDLYWTAVAVWSVALMILPYFWFRGRDRSSISGLMPLVTLPYIAGFLSGTGGSGLLPISSPWYLLLSSMALFALCMVTIALINSVSGMKLNLKFAMQVAYMFYASMVIIQSPAFFYSDQWLGTSIISSDAALMSYITLAMVNGLLMTVLFFVTARALMVRRGREAGEGAGE